MHLRRTLGAATGSVCKTILSAGVFGVLALAAPLAGHAQVLQVTIFDGTSTVMVTDGGLGDSSGIFGTPNGIVTVDSALTPPFALGASSSVTATFTQTAFSSKLTTGGTLNGLTGTPVKNFTVTSSINNVLVPTGLVRVFDDTATVSFNSTPAPNKGTDTNGVDTSNMLNGLSTFDNPFTFNASGAGAESGSSTLVSDPGFIFLNSGAFAITSKTVIDVFGGTAQPGSSQYTTSSIITSAAVPEPGAVALFSSLAVCGSAFGLRRLRRKQ